jgi:glycosyltransferase involved in cell wall biosynthesis
MRCPTLNELPPPPPGKTGWPWTEESEQLPETMLALSGAEGPSGEPWPRVSIVTPSYNQGQFIEETIRSVLLQGYPDLEYIIIDGGSTDGSVEIIRKYEPWLAYWVSEKDSGQSDAINKGFARATGEFVAWLNSDDWYQPDVFASRATYLTQHSEVVLVYGDCNHVDEDGKVMWITYGSSCTAFDLAMEGNKFAQPSVFMRTSMLHKVGGLSLKLCYVMDYDLWVRMGLQGEMHPLPGIVANFRYQIRSKSVSSGYLFRLEELSWFKTSSFLETLLHEDQRMELCRRLHIKAAMEYLLAANTEESVQHFSAALSSKVWPYGNIDNLACLLEGYRGLNGQRVCEVPSAFERLGEALRQVITEYHRARRLWRRTRSIYHMRKVFADYSPHQAFRIREDLLKGLWADPRWLANLGVWSILIHTLIPSFVWRVGFKAKTAVGKGLFGEK